MRSLGVLAAVVGVLCLGGAASAAVIDFDDLADGDIVTNQYAGLGVDLSGALVMTAGVSLNEIDFPPRSLSNVILDSSGPITLLFSTPVAFVTIFATYAEQMGMEAFDASDVSLGSVSSACTANFSSSGNAGCFPNEQFDLDSVGPISKIVITGNAAGSSFVLDDLTFRAAEDGDGTTVIPEPTTALLTALGCGALAFIRRKAWFSIRL